MKHSILVLYGLFAYLLFNASFIYMLGFLQNVGVPKGINDGTEVSVPLALAINSLLIFLFGFFHSVMARDGFKRWWTRIVPKESERPTFVLQSAVFLFLAMIYWQPMPNIVWQFDGYWVLVAYVFFLLGIATVLVSTFLIDHFELFGLKQVWFANKQRDMPESEFVQPLLYRLVRHPMQLGMVILLFSTPKMTVGHLLFAALMTAYVLVGLYFEERALLREFGDKYREYQQRVPMLIPRPSRLRVIKPSIDTKSGGVQ